MQQLDKESGLPVWSVSVLDADPAARKSDRTVTMKIAAPHQPVPRAPADGVPFAAVEFEMLTVRRICLRVATKSRVGMVLGEHAYNRGA